MSDNAEVDADIRIRMAIPSFDAGWFFIVVLWSSSVKTLHIPSEKHLFSGLWSWGPMRPHIRKEDGKKDETMSSSNQHNAQVHPEQLMVNNVNGWNDRPEIEYCEDLWLGKTEDEDPAKLSEGDPRQDGAAHGNHRLPCVLHPLHVAVHGKGAGDVAAELHADPHCHHQVDQGDCVQGDVPGIHDAPKIDQNEDNAEENYRCRSVKIFEKRTLAILPEIHSHEEKCDHKDGGERDANGVESVLPHGEVLLIEDIEDGVGEDVDVVSRRSVSSKALI